MKFYLFILFVMGAFFHPINGFCIDYVPDQQLHITIPCYKILDSDQYQLESIGFSNNQRWFLIREKRSDCYEVYVQVTLLPEIPIVWDLDLIVENDFCIPFQTAHLMFHDFKFDVSQYGFKFAKKNQRIFSDLIYE